MTKQEVRPLWLGLSAGTAVAVLAAGLFLISSETVLRSSFSTALGHASIPAKEVASAAPVSGSEEFWLSAMRGDGNAPVTKTINVGDQDRIEPWAASAVRCRWRPLLTSAPQITADRYLGRTQPLRAGDGARRQ